MTMRQISVCKMAEKQTVAWVYKEFSWANHLSVLIEWLARVVCFQTGGGSVIAVLSVEA